MTRFVRAQAGIRRAPRVPFTFDGAALEGHSGETLLTALAAQGIVLPGRQRGFCMMGACQECVVELSGRKVEACRTPLTAGMAVSSARHESGR